MAKEEIKGKIYSTLTDRITDARKHRNTIAANAYSSIKTELTNWATGKETAAKFVANGHVIPEDIEIDIIKAYCKSLSKVIWSVGLTELTQGYQEEIEILSEFLPKQPTKEDIIECFKAWRRSLANGGEPTYEISPAEKGSAIKFIKNELAEAPGKDVADVVSSFIKK